MCDISLYVISRLLNTIMVTLSRLIASAPRFSGDGAGLGPTPHGGGMMLPPPPTTTRRLGARTSDLRRARWGLAYKDRRETDPWSANL